MKILVVCQYYYPEPVRIADICEELVKCGHEVTVLTGIPNYPMGIIHKDYRYGKKRDENINGVHVIRCFTIGRRHGVLFRVLNYFSYPLSAMLKIPKLDKDFDYSIVPSLRREAVQKLNLYKPLNIGQASRISGVSPADISVLLVYLEQFRHQKK